MTDAHYEATFGGLDYDGGTVPDRFRDTVGASRGASVEFPTFREVLKELREQFGIEAEPAYYKDPETGSYHEVPNRVVTVNPAWLGEGLADAPQNSAAWTTASDEYATTDAMDQFGPLMPMARERGLDDAFGHVRTYRNGGQVSVDVFFPGLSAEDPDLDGGTARWFLGFEGGYDYFLGQSLRATVIAFDAKTGAVLRGLSKRYNTPHRGAAGDRMAEWYETMLDRAEKVGETLYEVVAEARAYTFNLNDLPPSVVELYGAFGFPHSSVAEPAADMVRNVRSPSAWDLYEPVALVLSRDYEGKVGGSALADHASRANDILYSPAKAEQTAYRKAAENLEGQETLLGDDDEDAADVLRRKASTLDEAVDRSLSFRRKVRLMLDENVESEADGDEDDEQDAEDDEQDAEDEAEAVADGGFKFGESRGGGA